MTRSWNIIEDHRYCCGQFWIKESTTHSLILHSSIYQTLMAHSLCARHGVRTIHTNSLLLKGSESPRHPEGERQTAFLQRHPRGVQRRCQHWYPSHARTKRKRTSQQAGFSLEPKNFSKQRFVLRDMPLLVIVTFSLFPISLGSVEVGDMMGRVVISGPIKCNVISALRSSFSMHVWAEQVLRRLCWIWMSRLALFSH